jgi:outer membrane receptor protein involved in Fe transport
VNYVGDRKGPFGSNAQQDFPAYTTVNLKTGAMFDTWTVNLYADNVGNERGLVAGGTGYIQLNSFIYIKPRVVGLNVQKSF